MTAKDDNNGAGDFSTRAGKAATPAEWLRIMLEWMRAREAADERHLQLWRKEQAAREAAWQKKNAEREAADEKRLQLWRKEQAAREAAWQKKNAEREAADEKRWQAWQKKNAERRAADEKEWQAWQERSRRQEEKLDRIGDRLGGWGNVVGEIFEDECAAAVRKDEGLAGVHFDHVYVRLRNADRGDDYEYDIVGVNKKQTMAVEVKRTLRSADLLRFADARLPAFAKLFPNHVKGRKVSGAVIFRRAPLDRMPDGTMADPIAIALQRGIIAVQATGKNKLQPVSDLDKVRR